MDKIVIENGKYLINGKSGILLSGELPYFRVPSSDWKKRMRMMRESGFHAISSYMPWVVHEPEQGKFHFDCGDGATDIRKYLDTAAECELRVIARPGPYQYSELLHYGLPEWLTEKYPQILALKRNGQLFQNKAVSYLHPVFLEYVEKYFAQIAPILADYSVTNGGPVFLTQLDNELFGMHLWSGEFDFNPQWTEFGIENGRYAEYLKKRFGSLEFVNFRYGTNCKRFSEFSPSCEPCNGTAQLLWNRDYADFYFDAGTEYLGILADSLKKYGLDTPFCHNSGHPNMNALFRNAKIQMGNNLLLGSDHYYNLSQTWPQNNPTPQYMFYRWCSLESLRLMGDPPSILEFPFGSPSDWPVFTADDLSACLYAHIGAGMRGLNGYIYSGGPNVIGTGANHEVYDFNAPVSASGEVRHTAEILKKFGNYLHNNPDLAEADAVSDFQIVMPWQLVSYNDEDYLPNEDLALNPAKIWKFLHTGVLTSAFSGGLLPQLADITRLDSNLPVLLVNNGTLSKEEQQCCINFLKQGGSMVFVPLVPELDENFQPCTLLADYIGVRSSKCQDHRLICHVDNVGRIFDNNSLIFPTTTLACKAKIIAENSSGFPILWEHILPDGGKVAVIAFTWLHSFKSHSLMLEKVLTNCGMNRHLLNDNYWTFVFWRGNKIFINNLGSSNQKTRLQIRKDAATDYLDLGEFSLAPMSVKIITI